MYSSADEQAERAAAQYQDKRTREQKRWDERAYQVGEYIARMRTMTQSDRVSWSRDPKTRDAMEEYLKDALREVRALQVEGFREGDPVGGVPEVKIIATKVVGVERSIKVADLDRVNKGAA